LSKKVLENQVSSSNGQLKKLSYAQASKSNIKEIIKIKDVFPKLFADKFSEIYKVINNLSQKDKTKPNIITKCYNSKSLE